jgi:hypothetical protein
MRDSQMDEFNAEGSPKFLFLLSTRGKIDCEFVTWFFGNSIRGVFIRLHLSLSLSLFQLVALESTWLLQTSWCCTTVIGILKSIFKQVSSWSYFSSIEKSVVVISYQLFILPIVCSVLF